jgi:ribA/ribD-fused uncharacterized protein
MNNLFFGENVISEFQDEFRFLSNFYDATIVYGSYQFRSSEHFYQSCKYLFSEKTERDKEIFLKMTDFNTTAGQAKRLSEEFTLDKKKWDQVKIKYMKIAVHEKFEQNDDLRTLLKRTKFAYLQEGNRWGDVFWGVCLKTGKGKNMLGKVLMDERKFIIHTDDFADSDFEVPFDFL